MERSMKCSVLVATAGVLAGRDQSLVEREDGLRVQLEVSFVLRRNVYARVLRLAYRTHDTTHATRSVFHGIDIVVLKNQDHTN